MIKVTKIKMNDVKSNVNPLIEIKEIKEIYLEGVKSPGFYIKESIYTTNRRGNGVQLNYKTHFSNTTTYNYSSK